MRSVQSHQQERTFYAAHRSQFSCPVIHVQPTALASFPRLPIHFCSRFQPMLVNRTCYNSERKAGWFSGQTGNLG